MTAILATRKVTVSPATPQQTLESWILQLRGALLGKATTIDNKLFVRNVQEFVLLVSHRQTVYLVFLGTS